MSLMPNSQGHRSSQAQPSLKPTGYRTGNGWNMGGVLGLLSGIISRFTLALCSTNTIIGGTWFSTAHPILHSFSLLNFRRIRFLDSVRNDQLPSINSPPIHRLPVELLREIFLVCHRAQDDTCEGKFHDVRVIISHICHHWRAVALSIPLLWSNIIVRCPNWHTIDRVRVYLERSGSCPLFLSIMESPLFDERDRALVDNVLLELIHHCHRWKTIALDLFGHAEFLPTFLPSDGFCALESADLDLRGWEQEAWQVFVEKLQKAPCFCSFSWAGDIPADMSWSRMTSVSLHTRLSTSDVLGILRQCQQLVEFNLGGLCEGGNLELRPITVPRLASLSIISFTRLDALYDHLNVPVLRSFSIRHCLDSNIYQDWSSFGRLLGRSACRLERFTLWDTSISDHDLSQCLILNGLQTLVELCIQQPGVSDTVLQLLSPKRVPCILPRLRKVEFWVCHAPDSVLDDLISSRSSLRPEQYVSIRDSVVQP